MLLIAHRGNNNHNFSENSKEAIYNCLNDDNIVGIEIDVRITKDKKLVLIHDPVIDFISDGNGIVKYMNLAELRKYQYGKGKSPLATLEEVLAMYNEKTLLIELKEIGNDYIDLVDELVKTIHNYSHLNIYVSSFNFNLLNYLKSNYPFIKCGLIIGYGLNMLKINNNFDFYVIQYRLLELLPPKKDIFVFSVPTNISLKISNETKIITDTAYKFLN